MKLLTSKQKERLDRDTQIVREYRAMRNRYPEASRNLILCDMAERQVCGITTSGGIRVVLVRMNAL